MLETSPDCLPGQEHDFSEERDTVVAGEVVGTDHCCSRCGKTVEEVFAAKDSKRDV